MARSDASAAAVDTAAAPSAAEPWLAALVPGDQVDGYARVLRSARAVARTGAPFHTLELGDASGATITARRFDVGDEPAPEPGTVVRVTGVVEAYRGTRCLKLTGCAPAPDVPVAALLPRMPTARAASLADLDELIAAIGDPPLRAWIDACVGGRRAAFAIHPAAQTIHGALVGGLLAHTVRVTRLARALAELLPGTDCDVVTVAALLHDVGKLEELAPVPVAEPTAAGRLLGHLVLGARLAWAAAAGIPELEPAVVEAVVHALLASHGTRADWGSPVAPATAEAWVVAVADLAEARLEQVAEARERTPAGEAWTAYLPALGTRLRTGR